MRPDSKTRRLALAALCLAPALGLAPAAADDAPREGAGRAGENARQGVPVEVAQASAGCFSEAIRLGAYLQPRADAVVVATLDAYQVAEVFAREGDAVAEGQPLARLQRVEGPNPYPPGMGPPAAGPPLPASIVLRAPAAGTIIETRAGVGATSLPQTPLFRIAVDGLIEAMVQVPSVHLGVLKPEQPAVVVLEDGRELEGRVRRIGGAVDPKTQMGEARVAFARDPAAHVGRLARVRIEARQSCGVAIPGSAIFYSNEGPSAQIVRGRVVETARVRPGLRAGADVEIREGLRAGDLVVLNAGGSLRDGDVVSPILKAEPRAAAPERN
ncbi:efflux RND transporter periplasmic adaptor subunit [Methylocella sp.]|uniref:efflux RND transporter periplasmic adaptor subunit n=1 Tax=Methylocella sp. TaxID=1978226 RepID=UPI003784E604